ncbi:MAG: hypothetical protein C0501_09650 [Isosphaera sp.]|nr:hypothetical protein [Isosphaera sp.]
MARLVYPEPPALPAAPTPLQKVRHEQVRAGYLFLMKAHTVLECGRVDSPFYPTYLQVATDTYRVAAELDPAPGWRVRCYEARVILMKDCERVIKARVDAEVEPPHSADQARFTRLQAEADLLKLKAEVEKAGKK